MHGLIKLTNKDGKLDSLDFSTPPTSSTAPTTGSQLANKDYVDDMIDAIDVTNPTFTQPILQTLLTANDSNKNNTALGENSLSNYYSNSIGSNNTGVSAKALQFNTTGCNNKSKFQSENELNSRIEI